MYSYYPDDLIEEVRCANDIEDIVSLYVKLEKKGKYLFGLCPFHKEKTASFSVTPSKQMYYCYSCGRGGNVIHFIMNVENVDFINAFKILAEKAKISLPDGNDSEYQESTVLKRELLNINIETARVFYQNLNSNEGKKAREYLRSRNIKENILRKFGIGYSLDSFNSLFKYLLEKGFKEEYLIKSGLFIQSKNGSYYDRFRNRIMFPIFDVRGNILGFGGRVIDKRVPKYMNSSETVLYSKGKNLYNLNFAKNFGANKMLMVEGYMDVISLYQSGITNVVASLGTALTESQVYLLKKYTKEVILSYDADGAGQTASMRGVELLDKLGLNVKVMTITNGKDPDEFVRKFGANELTNLINNSYSLHEYKVNILKKQINTETTEGKIEFLNKTTAIISKIDNDVEREIYIKKIADEYGITEKALTSELIRITNKKNKLKIKAITQNFLAKKVTKNKESKDELINLELKHLERVLLVLLCEDNEVFRYVEKHINIEDFTDAKNQYIAKVVFDKLKNKKGIILSELLNILESDLAQQFVYTMQNESNFDNNNKAAMDLITKIKFLKLDKRMHEIVKLLNKKDLLKEEVENLEFELKSILTQKKKI